MRTLYSPVQLFLRVCTFCSELRQKNSDLIHSYAWMASLVKNDRGDSSKILRRLVQANHQNYNIWCLDCFVMQVSTWVCIPNDSCMAVTRTGELNKQCLHSIQVHCAPKSNLLRTIITVRLLLPNCSALYMDTLHPNDISRSLCTMVCHSAKPSRDVIYFKVLKLTNGCEPARTA